MNFLLKDNNGEIFDLPKYVGDNRLLLVFFRGSWCNHCKKQLQDLERHAAEFEKSKVKILAISSDSAFNSSLLKTFLKLNFPILSDSTFSLIDQFNLKTTYKDKKVAKPSIFLFEGDKIIFNYVGIEYDDRLSAKTILEKIKSL